MKEMRGTYICMETRIQKQKTQVDQIQVYRSKDYYQVLLQSNPGNNSWLLITCLHATDPCPPHSGYYN